MFASLLYGVTPRAHPPEETDSFHRPAKQPCGETLGDLEPVYDPFPITSEFTLSEAVAQAYMYVASL